MRMKKNAMWIVAMFVTALLSAFIAGCGGGGQSGAGGQQAAAPAAGAAKYPTRPIEFIVPWGPGGGADQMARLTGKNAEKILKVSMPILNVAGATGATGMAKLLAGSTEGYSISVYIADTHAVMTTGKAAWKLEDFTPVAVMMKVPSYLFAKADGPFKTWADFEKAAKASPGKYKVGILGEGSVDDITLQYLKSKGIEVIGVPFPNPGERYTSVLGGHVDLLYEQAGDVRQYLDGKQIRPLIIFDEQRLAAFPDVPCSKELGYNIFLPQFRSIIIKAGTDPVRVKLLADAFKQVYDSPEYQKFLVDQYAAKNSYVGPSEAAAFMKKELETMNSFLTKK